MDQLLDETIEAFQPFDRQDLLASVSALQLCPENATFLARLMALSHVIASLTPEPDLQLKKISISRLQKICNDLAWQQDSVAALEDPSASYVTEEVAFFGGSFVVFPGDDSQGVFVFRQLCSALFLLEEPLSNDELRRESFHLLRAVLVLSNEIAIRAGMRRGLQPDSSALASVRMPDAKQMANLKAATCFTESELALLLRSARIPRTALDVLITDLGQVSPVPLSAGNGIETVGVPPTDVLEDGLNSGALLAHPIVQSEDLRIVAIPCALLRAATNHILRRSIDLKILDELVHRFTTAVWMDVVRSMRYLNCPYAGRPSKEPTQGKHVREGVFDLDSDKLAYVLLVTDPLDDVPDDISRLTGSWKQQGLQEIVRERLENAVKVMAANPQPPASVLAMVVIETMGRPYTMALNLQGVLPESWQLLSWPAIDLGTAALLEAGDRLALWKFAQALSDAKEHTTFMSLNTLDAFAAYRAYHHSIPYPKGDDLTDDELHPTGLFVTPAMGADLYRQALQDTDIHGVPGYSRRSIIEVANFYQDIKIPIYAELGSATRDDLTRLALLVEGLELPLWIVSPTNRKPPSRSEQSVDGGSVPSLNEVAPSLVDGLAYWIWQVSKAIEGLLQPIALREERLVLVLRESESVNIDSVQSGTDTNAAYPTVDSNYSVSCRLFLGRGIVIFGIDASRIYSLADSDNSGERQLLFDILRCFRDVAKAYDDHPWDGQSPGPPQHRDAENWSDLHLGELVDKYAPQGLKKKINLAKAISRNLDSRALPSARLIQEFDMSIVDTEISSAIRASGMVTGRIPPDQQQRLTTTAVEYCFASLARLAANLHPEGLLEWLIACNESLTQMQSADEVTMPTTAACFGMSSDVIRQLNERQSILAQSNIASRFLIEYLTSNPPSGSSIMSLETYDRLLALSARLVYWGFQGDLIRNKLSEIDYFLTAGGDLVSNRDKYEKAAKKFVSGLSVGQIARANEDLKLRVGKGTNSSNTNEEQANASLANLDNAFQAEFGYTVTDLVKLLVQVEAIGDLIDPTVPMLEFESFLQQLCDRLTWPMSRVKRVLDTLTLQKREDFEYPPKPFSSSDIYPWRFNRALSYVRRPFLVRQSGEINQILWGPRHLFVARLYLLDLCFSGRLKATSKPMKLLISSYATAQGLEFNNKVADYLLIKYPGQVTRRVDKVETPRGVVYLLDEEGNELGDIDVLFVDSAHKRIYAIECKALAVSRMPNEIANEIDKLFPPKDGKKAKRTFTQKHHRRVQWVRQNLDALLESRGIQRRGTWNVEGLMVIDQELISPHLREAPFRIVSFDELSKII